MNIAIYTLTSELHDENATSKVTNDFLGSLQADFVFMGNDYSDYGSHSLDLIYIRTGGTEGLFKRMLPKLSSHTDRPFYLLTSGKSNSLAASMEILSFLRQNGLKGEILHGSPDYISKRIYLLAKVGEAKRKLKGSRLGIIGEPSDWLISSHADRNLIKSVLGLDLIDIPMQELLNVIASTPVKEPKEQGLRSNISQALPGAYQIYDALKVIVQEYQLQGFTIRCFDLLTALHNTGCLALAKLNAEGIVAGCEGDVPAMLSMRIAQSLLDVSGFQANPASIDPETGRILFAHCTIPLNMIEHYELDTHFESGIGVAINGYMKEGPVTIFKVAGDLSRHFIAEGELMESQSNPDLCRTQQIIQLADKKQATYFLTEPIGNQHIILPGHHKTLLEEMVRWA